MDPVNTETKPDKLSELYKTLSQDDTYAGIIPDEKKFRETLADTGKADSFYKTLKADDTYKDIIPDKFEEFQSKLGLSTPKETPQDVYKVTGTDAKGVSFSTPPSPEALIKNSTRVKSDMTQDKFLVEAMKKRLAEDPDMEDKGKRDAYINALSTKTKVMSEKDLTQVANLIQNAKTTLQTSEFPTTEKNLKNTIRKADAHHILGDNENAVKEYKDALKMDKGADSPEVWLGLAQSYSAMGKDKDAQETFKNYQALSSRESRPGGKPLKPLQIPTPDWADESNVGGLMQNVGKRAIDLVNWGLAQPQYLMQEESDSWRNITEAMSGQQDPMRKYENKFAGKSFIRKMADMVEGSTAAGTEDIQKLNEVFNPKQAPLYDVITTDSQGKTTIDNKKFKDKYGEQWAERLTNAGVLSAKTGLDAFMVVVNATEGGAEFMAAVDALENQGMPTDKLFSAVSEIAKKSGVDVENKSELYKNTIHLADFLLAAVAMGKYEKAGGIKGIMEKMTPNKAESILEHPDNPEAAQATEKIHDLNDDVDNPKTPANIKLELQNESENQEEVLKEALRKGAEKTVKEADGEAFKKQRAIYQSMLDNGNLSETSKKHIEKLVSDATSKIGDAPKEGKPATEEKLPAGYRVVEKDEVLPPGDYDTHMDLSLEKTITNAPKKAESSTAEKKADTPEADSKKVTAGGKEYNVESAPSDTYKAGEFKDEVTEPLSDDDKFDLREKVKAGDYAPIIVNGKGDVLDGNNTLEAAQAEGIPIDAIKVGDEITSEQARAIRTELEGATKTEESKPEEQPKLVNQETPVVEKTEPVKSETTPPVESDKAEHSSISSAEEAHAFADKKGFKSANHMLNAIKQFTGKEYKNVQDVPKDVMDRVLKNKNRKSNDETARNTWKIFEDSVFGDRINKETAGPGKTVVDIYTGEKLKITKQDKNGIVTFDNGDKINIGATDRYVTPSIFDRLNKSGISQLDFEIMRTVKGYAHSWHNDYISHVQMAYFDDPEAARARYKELSKIFKPEGDSEVSNEGGGENATNEEKQKPNVENRPVVKKGTSAFVNDEHQALKEAADMGLDLTKDQQKKLSAFEKKKPAPPEKPKQKAKALRGNRVSKANRTIRNPRQLAALKIEADTPHDMALQYFIGGGKIRTEALQKLFGNKHGKSIRGEQNARIGLLKKDGLNIDEIAHQLWESGNDYETEKYTTMDYREAVEDVIQSHNGIRTMTDEILNKHKITVGDHEAENEIEEAAAMLPDDIKDQFHEYGVSPEIADVQLDADQLRAIESVIERHTDANGNTDFVSLQKEIDDLDPLREFPETKELVKYIENETAKQSESQSGTDAAGVEGGEGPGQAEEPTGEYGNADQVKSKAKEYKAAQRAYESARDKLSENTQQNQSDIFGKTPQDELLFKHDIKDESGTVKQLKIKADNLKAELDEAIRKSQISPSQQNLFEEKGQEYKPEDIDLVETQYGWHPKGQESIYVGKGVVGDAESAKKYLAKLLNDRNKIASDAEKRIGNKPKGPTSNDIIKGATGVLQTEAGFSIDVSKYKPFKSEGKFFSLADVKSPNEDYFAVPAMWEKIDDKWIAKPISEDLYNAAQRLSSFQNSVPYEGMEEAHKLKGAKRKERFEQEIAKEPERITSGSEGFTLNAAKLEEQKRLDAHNALDKTRSKYEKALRKYNIISKDGNIQQAGFDGKQIFDAAFKIAHASIDAFYDAKGKISDIKEAVEEAVKRAIDHIKESEWYKDLSAPQKKVWDDVIKNNVEKSATEYAQEKSKEDESFSGIAERVKESEGIAPEPGQGWSPEQAIQIGKDLIQDGADPNKVIEDFNKDGKISGEMMAIVNARENELAKLADEAADEFGENSKEYKELEQSRKEWLNKVQPMQTEWQKSGAAQQGQTEVNTGSFTSLKREFKNIHDQEPTKEQAEELKKLSDENKGLKDQLEKKSKEVFDALDKATKEPKTRKPSGKIRSVRVQEANAKIAEGIDGLFSKIGVKKNLLPEEKTMVLDDIKKIISGIVEKGDIGLEDAIKFAKEYIAKHYPDVFNKSEIDSKFAPEREIVSLEKQINDLEEGKVRGGTVKAKGEPTPDQAQQIADLKEQKRSLMEKYGLIPSKALPESKPSENAKWMELHSRFANKNDNVFTHEDVADIWKYARDRYVDSGNYEFEDMISNTATDLGLTTKQVYEALGQPKEVRKITDEMYEIMYKRRIADQRARDYIKTANTPKLFRVINSIPRNLFGFTVLGHGTVFHITHAGTYIFRPTAWSRYFPSYFRQFKFAFNKVNFEKGVQMHQRDPMYTFAKRTGLEIDANKKYGDDYQMFGKYFGTIGESGDRGMFSLKMFRLEEFKARWDRLSDAERADPNMAKTLATLVNHSTGASHVRVPKWVSTVGFAPKLEVTRWQRLIVDPAKALTTLGKITLGKEVSPAERASARIVGRNAAEIAVTGAALLAANQALLSMTGSKQKINITDPTKTDFFKFKGYDKTLDVTGGMLSSMRFIAHLVVGAVGEQQVYKGKVKPRSQVEADILGHYLRGKLAPIGALGMEVITKTDYSGNVVPWSNDRPEKRYQYKLGVGEYAAEKLPIPFSEGLRDIIQTMREKGMKDVDIKTVLSGFATTVFSGGTGARVLPDFEAEKQQDTYATDNSEEVKTAGNPTQSLRERVNRRKDQ